MKGWSWSWSAVVAVCLLVTAPAVAQRLDTAPAVAGSGCAQAVEAWKGLSSSNSVEALKGFRAGIPKTCPDQLAATSARIAKLEAAANAERGRQQEAAESRERAAAALIKRQQAAAKAVAEDRDRAAAAEVRRQQAAAEEQERTVAAEVRRQQEAAEEQKRAVATQRLLQDAADREMQGAAAIWRNAAEAFGPKAIAAQTGRPLPEREFRDEVSRGPTGPQMVVVPAGSFVMGSSTIEGGRLSSESPQRTVTIGYQLAVGKYEVTWAEYATCVAARSCPKAADDRFGKGMRPVTNVSWDDAKAYAAWLSDRTGKPYRLLSEAEWEYVSRAGTTTAYPWGGTASHESANYGPDACCGGLASGRDNWVNTSPVGSFSANAFGLHDMHGNVSEWVEDCYEKSYSAGQAVDGSSFTNGPCTYRVNRGGSWESSPHYVRSAVRYWFKPADRANILGFRVARTLP